MKKRIKKLRVNLEEKNRIPYSNKEKIKNIHTTIISNVYRTIS